MNSIPASELVNVVPSVISAGGSGLDLSGLFLSTSTRVPIGTVQSFPTLSSVGEYFGLSSDEYSAASTYFNGYSGSLVVPGALLFSQYNTANVAAYLRGGSLASMTLAQLNALPAGTIIVTVDGTLNTSAAIDLSTATSFSNAATLIAAGFTAPNFTVTYDATAHAFVFTSSTTGASSTITAATGTLSASLLLTVATGAVLSQGADAQTSPSAFMDTLILNTTNWASLVLLWDPDAGIANTIKMEFAAWVAAANNRYVFVCWDTDVTPTQSTNATTSMGKLLAAANDSGTILIWVSTSSFTKAAFVSGWMASIDFTATNGRSTLAFKSQSGLTADVTDALVSANLQANGYNFYGQWATANDQFIGAYPGSISGDFLWADSFVNQIWLNNSFQLALMTLLFNVSTIPYNPSGYALLRQACMDTINAGLNFGAFVANVTLSDAQKSEVNFAAGADIASVLQSNGWYLQILDASSVTRAARQTPPMKFWYVDGGSVQSISLASIEVQ